jgi:hypothetical protein
MPGSSCSLAMAIGAYLKKAFTGGLRCFSILQKDALKRIPYRPKMLSCIIKNRNVNGAGVSPASQVSAGDK